MEIRTILLGGDEPEVASELRRHFPGDVTVVDGTEHPPVQADVAVLIFGHARTRSHIARAVETRRALTASIDPAAPTVVVHVGPVLDRLDWVTRHLLAPEIAAAVEVTRHSGTGERLTLRRRIRQALLVSVGAGVYSLGSLERPQRRRRRPA